MSNHRFRKTVQEIDKECADTEKFLTKVLRRQIPKTRSSSKHRNRKQNASEEKGSRLFVTAPSGRCPSSSAGLKPGASSPPVQRKQHNHQYFHRNCLGSSTPMVDVKGKPKSQGRQRRRSLSAARSLPEKSDGRRPSKSNEASKQTSVINPPATCRPCNKVSPPKPTKCHDSKHLPWSEVLKENKVLWAADEDNGSLQSEKSESRAEKQIASRKSTIQCNVAPSDWNKPKCGSGESSLSGGSSDFTSSVELGEHLVNKSIQCWIPATSTAKQTSTTTVASSKVTEEANSKGAVDTFSMFNPVRTLNFLVRELHGFIKKSPEDRNLRRIVTDMEQALRRIPHDLRGGDVANIAVVRNNGLNLEIEGLPCKQSDTFMMPLVLKVDSSQLSASTKTSESVVLTKQLEESCLKLEAMCHEMETTNRELCQQRDRYEEEVKVKNQELEGLRTKEKDYLQAISTLRSNVETAVKAQTDLTTLTAHLREETKSLRASESKLKQQLQEVVKANEQLEKDMRMLQLEKEKLLVLNQSKDRELENFKKELMDIKAEVAQHLTEFRAQMQEIRQQSNFLDLDTTEPESVPSERISPRRPVCSSPNSSKCSLPKVDRSWQMISSIPPDNSVLVLSPVKPKLSFKSMEDDVSTEVSDLDETMNNQQTVIPVRSKEGQELKAELKNLFDEFQKQTKLSSTNITLPSPPRQFSATQPEDMLSVESSLNSSTLTMSELDSKTESENI